MTELKLKIGVRKTPDGIQTSFELLDEEALEAFGPWRGLPEAIQGLLHCALLLEGRMQVMRLLEEGRTPNPGDLPEKVLQMLETQARALLPQAIQRCLSELERIQVP